MRNDMYEKVTKKIIEQLEKGVIPWQRPWTGVREGAFNRITKKPYSVLNQMMLNHTGEYASFKQWNELGGKIKQGEKAETVCFYKLDRKVTINEETGEEEAKVRAVLRGYPVFHISQVEGVEPLPEPELVEANPIVDAETIKESYKNREPIIIEETISNRAFYRPSTDTITVPGINQYINVEEFYSTLFHEMVHSTGAKHRLNREELVKTAGFGSENYSKEELVAEIGSAMLCNQLGIDSEKSFQNSVSYIDGWLRALKNDKKLIVSAASRAEKAIKYILTGEKASY